MITTRRARIACVLALLLMLLPSVAVAAPPAAPPAQVTPGGQLGDLIILFPGLDRLPAPAWLVEGVRATYASSSATTADANGENGGGGGGLMQYDVVATERRTVAAYVSFYLDLGDGSVQNNVNFASVTSAGVGDFWVSPAALAKADNLNLDGLSVSHMPFTAAGQDFNALRLQDESDKITRVWMFDEASGILLYYRDDVIVGNGAHQLSQMTLAGLRTLKLPWKAGGPAFAIKQGDRLNYTGRYSTLITGSPALTLPMTTTATVAKARPRWTLTTNDSTFNGQPADASSSITGAIQLFGGIWLPASALAARPRRAVIDSDPLTGATVTFSRTNNGLIVITQSGPTWSTALYYDGKSGVFVGMHKEMQVGVAINTYDQEIVQ